VLTASPAKNGSRRAPAAGKGRLHRQGPAEHELVRYFGVTPPTVHGMIVKLEQLGLVSREPGVRCSMRVAINEEAVPPLEGVEGPPW
jgi:hypothetical protein